MPILAKRKYVVNVYTTKPGGWHGDWTDRVINATDAHHAWELGSKKGQVGRVTVQSTGEVVNSDYWGPSRKKNLDT